MTTVINPTDEMAKRRYPEAARSAYCPVGYALLVSEEAIQEGMRQVLSMSSPLRKAG